MSFLRHREIYQVERSWRGRHRGLARTSRLDESSVGYSLAGCSPAEPASASPTGGTLQQWRGALQLAIRCYLFTTLTRGLTLGAHPRRFEWKPFKRFPRRVTCEITALKNDANETNRQRNGVSVRGRSIVEVSGRCLTPWLLS